MAKVGRPRKKAVDRLDAQVATRLLISKKKRLEDHVRRIKRTFPGFMPSQADAMRMLLCFAMDVIEGADGRCGEIPITALRNKIGDMMEESGDG